MAEKFRKVVNAPHRAFGRAREKLQEMQPESKTGKAAQIAGIGASGLFQFLLWATKYVALDNHVLRKAEEMLRDMKVGKNKAGNDKKISAFMQKYPNFSAHMLYYLMFVLTIGGGKVATEITPEIAQTVKEWRITRAEERARRGTYAEFLNKTQPITPFLIADLIVKEGVHTDSNGMHIPYRDSKGIPTIGFGSTRLKDGTAVTMKTAPMTNDEAYELARWHLETEETYFVMYCYDVAARNKKITSTSECLGLGSIIYNAYSKLIENPDDKNHKNRFTTLRQDFQTYGFAIPNELVQQRFAEYPIVNLESFGQAWIAGENIDVVADKLGNFLAGGKGLIWRRWLEAGLLTGKITPQMLLNCPVNGMFEFYKCMGRKKDAFFIGNPPNRKVNNDTYDKLKVWLQNPVNEHGQSLANWKRVKEFLPADVLAVCQTGQCKLDSKNFADIRESEKQQNIEVKTYVLGYDELYTNAITLYRDGDYKNAADAFENMIKYYPDNALLHNDLAATYNNLGQYDKAIEHAQEIVRRIGDKSQYGAAQYNAGFAYEKKGNLQKALANYKLAVANGNRRAQKDVTRVANAIKNNIKSSAKQISFNQGAKNIRNNAHTADLMTIKNVRFNDTHNA